MRDQCKTCVAAHTFAEEIRSVLKTESNYVGENLATKGDELYLQMAN